MCRGGVLRGGLQTLRKSLSTAIQMAAVWVGAPSDLTASFLTTAATSFGSRRIFERIYHGGLDRLDDGEKMDRGP